MTTSKLDKVGIPESVTIATLGTSEATTMLPQEGTPTFHGHGPAFETRADTPFPPQTIAWAISQARETVQYIYRNTPPGEYAGIMWDEITKCAQTFLDTQTRIMADLQAPGHAKEAKDA